MVTQARPVLSRAEYDELMALVSAATVAASESARVTFQQYQPMTDDERQAAFQKAREAYADVATWAAQRTDHTR